MSRFAINLSRMKWRRKTLRVNQTESESLLWKRIKNKQLGYWFKRQVSFDHYVVDFYCPQIKLVIEIDGKSHIGKDKYDKHRENYLEGFGVKIMKFSDQEVLENIDEVIKKIRLLLFQNSPPLD